MNVRDLCKREVVSISANASVRDAAAAMRQHHVGALVVTDPFEPGKVVGIVTDRDMVVELLATGEPVDGQAVGAIARAHVVSIADTAALEEALNSMQHHGVRRLLVLDAGGAVCGLVSMDDLIESVAWELHELTAILRSGMVHEVQQTEAGRQGEQGSRGLYITRSEP